MHRIVPRGEMENAVKPGRDCLAIAVERMGAAVDDDERLLVLPQGVNQCGIIHRPREFETCSFQLAGKARCIQRKFPAAVERRPGKPSRTPSAGCVAVQRITVQP